MNAHNLTRKDLARKIIETSYLNKEGHVASAFSILDFLLYLYSDRLTEKDQFILSKGHGCLAFYAVLLKKGVLSEQDFYSFCQPGSKLGGHPSSKKIKEILVSTGSLGHGLPFSVGLALAKKIKKEPGIVYCLIGDGEANEGTIWESALIAATYNLNNLICVMDFNKSGERAIKLNDCACKFSAFGWKSHRVQNGNKVLDIQDEFEVLDYELDSRPNFIQLNTVKGFGCPIMENNPEWHRKIPSSDAEVQELIKSLY